MNFPKVATQIIIYSNKSKEKVIREQDIYEEIKNKQALDSLKRDWKSNPLYTDSYIEVIFLPKSELVVHTRACKKCGEPYPLGIGTIHTQDVLQLEPTTIISNEVHCNKCNALLYLLEHKYIMDGAPRFQPELKETKCPNCQYPAPFILTDKKKTAANYPVDTTIVYCNNPICGIYLGTITNQSKAAKYIAASYIRPRKQRIEVDDIHEAATRLASTYF